MTTEPEPMSSGLRNLQAIRDIEEYRTELLRLSVEQEKLSLERLRKELEQSISQARSMPLGGAFALGIMFGIGIFAVLEKLPAIIEAIKH